MKTYEGDVEDLDLCFAVDEDVFGKMESRYLLCMYISNVYHKNVFACITYAQNRTCVYDTCKKYMLRNVLEHGRQESGNLLKCVTNLDVFCQVIMIVCSAYTHVS